MVLAFNYEIAESIIRYIAFHSESPVNIKSLAVLKELSPSVSGDTDY